jgi:hypothetical protein
MKYYLVAVNPVEEGLNQNNTKLCVEAHIEMTVDMLATQYPNQPIVVLKPIALYNTKCEVKKTRFTINNKMEIIPA